MYEFDAYSNDELRTVLQENSDKQYDLEREYVRMNSDEAECMQSLKADRSALEALSVGWTGKDADYPEVPPPKEISPHIGLHQVQGSQSCWGYN